MSQNQGLSGTCCWCHNRYGQKRKKSNVPKLEGIKSLSDTEGRNLPKQCSPAHITRMMLGGPACCPLLSGTCLCTHGVSCITLLSTPNALSVRYIINNSPTLITDLANCEQDHLFHKALTKTMKSI